MKQYENYKDSGVEWIGKIPVDWEITQLGYLSQMIVPMRDKPKILKGEIPWLRIEDFEGKYVSKSKSNQGVTANIVDKMNLKVFPIGTVLCTCSCSMGTTAIVTKPLITNQTFIGIVPSKDLYSEYLYYLINSSKQHLESIASGAIQSYLSRMNFEKLRIPFPPLSEQQQISNYLDQKTTAIDQLIQKKEQLIQLLEEKRTAMINQAVTKGLDPTVPMKDSGIEWLGEVPVHWSLKRLKYLSLNTFSGGTPSTKVKEYWNGVIDWVSSADVKIPFINKTLRSITELGLEKSSSNLARKDSIIIVTRSGILQHTLPVAVLMKDMAINQDIKCFHLAENLIKSNYLLWFLMGKNYEILIKTRKQGATVESIEMEEFINLEIPVPALIEQEKIVHYLNTKTREIDQTITKKKEQIKLLKEYKTTLISEVVTGKIDVRAVAIETP